MRPDAESAYAEPFVLSNLVSLTVRPVAPPLASVFEFYNRDLNHYFITGDPAEVRTLINGTQPGWTPTGQQFGAFVVDAAASDIASVVCRFYGSVTPGPNSHFYTLSADECTGLKALAQTTAATSPRWNYEGNGFAAALPTANGSCAAEHPVQIRRFYNGLALQNDSNHRYVASATIAQQMRAAGWVDEGVVMCGGSESQLPN